MGGVFWSGSDLPRPDVRVDADRRDGTPHMPGEDERHGAKPLHLPVRYGQGGLNGRQIQVGGESEPGAARSGGKVNGQRHTMSLLPAQVQVVGLPEGRLVRAGESPASPLLSLERMTRRMRWLDEVARDLRNQLRPLRSLLQAAGHDPGVADGQHVEERRFDEVVELQCLLAKVRGVLHHTAGLANTLLLGRAQAALPATLANTSRLQRDAARSDALYGHGLVLRRHIANLMGPLAGGTAARVSPADAHAQTRRRVTLKDLPEAVERLGLVVEGLAVLQASLQARLRSSEKLP